MTTVQPPQLSNQTVELAPSYRLPLIAIAAAIPLGFVQPWLSLAIVVFGTFLFFQALTIRLQFTPTALDVYRSGNLLRNFPYSDWQNWRIFYEPVPILFYFKEVKSIHFLPVLFDPKMLKTCLESLPRTE